MEYGLFQFFPLQAEHTSNTQKSEPIFFFSTDITFFALNHQIAYVTHANISRMSDQPLVHGFTLVSRYAIIQHL